jgi:hypothetical protein
VKTVKRMKCYIMRLKRAVFGCNHSMQSYWFDAKGREHCNDCDDDCEAES